jgi:signal transduction histidine kinase
MEAVAATKAVTLTTEIPSNPLLCLGDETRLHQLCLILLDNAIKYNHSQGTVQIRLRRTTRHRIQLVVEDSGLGIPARDLPHIFDRFYRSASSKRQASGSGLGLAIATWIVREHHGHLDAQSHVGEGSRIIVELPIHGLESDTSAP